MLIQLGTIIGLLIVLAVIVAVIDTKDIDEVEHDYSMNQQ